MNDRHVGRIRDSQSLAAIAELSVFPTPADEFLIHAAEAPIGMFCKPKTATGTEIGDDLVNGSAPPDELNLVVPGANFGWPPCFDRGEAATNYGGTAEGCQATRFPVALFAPRSTPTSVVASPWEEDTLLVALWLQSTVARVTVTPDGDNATGVVEPFITGLRNPQSLLVLADGSVLVSEFSTGVIYQISKNSQP